jgi:hypothetical protein
MAKDAGDLYVPENMGKMDLPTGRLFDPKAHGYERVMPAKESPYIGIQGKTLHPNQFGRMVRNIERTVKSATPEEIQHGKTWYQQAHEMASEIGKGDVKRGAGVIAALSPKSSWTENVRMAREVSKTGSTRGYVSQAEVGRARRIMEGEDPETILPMEKKTGHFYKNILEPENPSYVTVDRHAHDIAIGQAWGGRERQLEGGRYNTFVNAHLQAAHRLGEIPSRVQATAWVRWRNLRGIGD